MNAKVVEFYLMETRIMANIRYLPSNGTTRDVGGMISTTSRKNTCRLIRIEIDKVTYTIRAEGVNQHEYHKNDKGHLPTFSPLSEGK